MIDPNVIARDKALSAAAETSQFDLDRHRWEQCADPTGPRSTQREYAAAVGRDHSTISDSVRAWARALAAQNPALLGGSPTKKKGKGRTQAETVEQVNAAIEGGQTLEQPTADAHSRARTSVSAGADLTTVIAALASAFSVSEVTAADTKPDWPQRRRVVLANAKTKAANGATWEDACAEAATELAREIEIEKEHARTRKEKDAAKSRRGSPAMFVVGAVINTTTVFERELAKIDGLDAVQWSADTVDALNQELAKLQALTDRVALLPTAQHIEMGEL